MKVTHALGADHALIVRPAFIARLLLQKPQHLLNTQSGGVLLRLVNALGHMTGFLFAFGVLVRIPLGHVLGEEVDNIVDPTARVPSCSEARFPQRIGTLLQLLCAYVETGSPRLP